MQLQNMFSILIYVVFKNSVQIVTGQKDPLEDRLQEEKDFIQPSLLANSLSVFTFKKQIDYIISNNELYWDDAKLHCSSLLDTGTLAVVDSEEKINFLSEALSETTKLFDNLWIAGLLDKEGNWTTGYSTDAKTHYLPKELLDKYNATKNRIPYNIIRDCLTFRRSDHQKGNFVDLNCFSQRSYICQQTHSVVLNTSSHHGWIRLGNRLYKLFYDKATWENASINCFEVNSKLAVIDNYKDAQYLGRYLLVGRPKLENAWIGAKWSFEHALYMFGAENIKLDNKTDEETNYPPWRYKTIKTGGCVLLDRHLKKITLFVEARCQRLRPYICYKPVVSLQHETNNSFTFPERDYIMHYNKLRFVEALAKCTYEVNGANGIVAQPKSAMAVNELLFMMGENKAYVQQIWLGGKYVDGKWKWLKQKKNASQPNETDEDIPEESDSNGYPPWIVNETYTEDVECMYTCLNMDRENHLEALFYGVDCYYAQGFICQYPSGTITKPTSTVSSSEITLTTTTTKASTTTKDPHLTYEYTSSISINESPEGTDLIVTGTTTNITTKDPHLTYTPSISTDESSEGTDLIVTETTEISSTTTEGTFTSKQTTSSTTTEDPHLTTTSSTSTNESSEGTDVIVTDTTEISSTTIEDTCTSKETISTTATEDPQLTTTPSISTTESPDGPDLIVTDKTKTAPLLSTKSTPTTETTEHTTSTTAQTFTTSASTNESPDGPDLIVTDIRKSTAKIADLTID